MKPHRIKMTHALILHYGLYNDLEVMLQPNQVSMHSCTYLTREIVHLAVHATDYWPESLTDSQSGLYMFTLGRRMYAVRATTVPVLSFAVLQANTS